MWAWAAEVAAPMQKLCVLKHLVSWWSLDSMESSNAEKAWRVNPLPSCVMKSDPALLPRAAKYDSMPDIGNMALSVAPTSVNIYSPSKWICFWLLDSYL